MPNDAKPLAQGKTKAIFAVDDNPNVVRIKSLDSITAGNAARRNEIEGKSEIASRTTSNVFRFLKECGWWRRLKSNKNLHCFQVF